MFARTLLIACFAWFAIPSLADEPSMGPVIADYGPTYPIDDRDIPLGEDTVYKVVFDAGSYSGDVSGLNSELVSVARFLNMHARNGVALENMDIAVVAHADALKSMLSDDAYKSRYQIENPNHDLLIKLNDAGVKFYACGQSMHFRDVGKDELASPVKVGLSAMTIMTVLQNEGYALLP
jgi:intracellular sulfur oxidation DsrE/DsrF family protein